MAKQEKKDKLKDELTLPNGELLLLSAQSFAGLSLEDMDALKELFTDELWDYDEYMKKAKELWPAVTSPKPLKWRNK